MRRTTRTKCAQYSASLGEHLHAAVRGVAMARTEETCLMRGSTQRSMSASATLLRDAPATNHFSLVASNAALQAP